jgi:hypothetical protein
MVEAARGASASAQSRARRPQRLRAPGRVAATTVFRAIYYARDRRRSSGTCRVHRRSSSSTSTRASTAWTTCVGTCERGFGSVELRPFFVPQTVSLPRPLLAAATALERSGPLARLALRVRFTYLVAASR